MRAFDPKRLLGKAESDHLEFKEAAALRRPANIGREVVGFLNAGGGDIWVGVEEKDGRAVGFQPIADIERARSALLDHLIDTIEPPFRSDEVDVKCEGDLIHVTVKKGMRLPYAQRDSGRRFWIRIDHRLREMSREEIGKEFAKAFKAESTRKDRVAEIAAELRKDSSCCGAAHAPALAATRPDWIIGNRLQRQVDPGPVSDLADGSDRDWKSPLGVYFRQ